MMNIADYMCLEEKEENMQLVLTFIFMAIREVWNMLIIVCCADVEEIRSYEI